MLHDPACASTCRRGPSRPRLREFVNYGWMVWSGLVEGEDTAQPVNRRPHVNGFLRWGE